MVLFITKINNKSTRCDKNFSSSNKCLFVMRFLTMHSQNFILFSFIALTIFFINNVKSVRVCKSFMDYYLINSDGCYDNPDTRLNVTEILRQRWNCTAEEYNLITDDGYQILVVRAYRNITHSTPIVLGHGIIMNSLGFLSLYDQSLAYKIISSGRQLFFVNYRGTRYSTGHTGNITQNDYAYWQFSFHEMGQYDTPKILDLVKRVTGQKAIFVAYSMSSTIGLTYATLFPEDALDKLKGIITMSTTVFFQHSTSSLVQFARVFPTFIEAWKLIWNGKICPIEQTRLFAEFSAQGPIQFLISFIPFGTATGSDLSSISPEFFPVVALNTVDCIGQNVALHFAQLIKSNTYRQFDYGTQENIKKYGTPTPPSYDLTKINVPVAQIVGSKDLLGTVENAVRVNDMLNPNIRCGLTLLEYEHWTHDDFVDSKYQAEYLAPVVLNKIAEMESTSCKKK